MGRRSRHPGAVQRIDGRESKELTQLVLRTYGTICHLCGLPGADSKDHLIPWSWTKDDSLPNLRPAHVSCNSRRGNRAIPGYGADVVVVMGPPAGGKSTFVREHAQPHDVVIDYDVIARALSADLDAPEYSYPDHVGLVAVAARRAAIERAMRLNARCTVWIIHAVPSPRDLDDYRFMRYGIQVIDPGYDVVRSRARDLRPPAFMEAVSTWYRSYRGLESRPSPALALTQPADSSEPSTDRKWW